MTLFDAFNPPKSSGGKADRMSNMYGFGNVQKGNQRMDKRNVAQRSFDVISGLLWFGSRKDGVFQYVFQFTGHYYAFSLMLL